MGEPTTIVRFTKKYPPFNVQEEAIYDAKTAQVLVEGGVAVFTKPPPGLDEKGQPIAGGLTEPVHRGGGHYLVGDHAVRGKETAWKLYEQLKGGPESEEAEEPKDED